MVRQGSTLEGGGGGAAAAAAEGECQSFKNNDLERQVHALLVFDLLFTLQHQTHASSFSSFCSFS